MPVPVAPIILSLVICSRNRAHKLQQCLETLPKEEFGSQAAELILVDSASRDDTGKIMREYKQKASFPVKVITAERKGLGYARKLAVKSARGEVLVFTDDDCYLGKDYLLKASQVFNDGRFHYGSGRILPYDPGDAKFALNLKEKFEYIPPYSYLPTGTVHGANFIVHRSIFEKIGSFDENLGDGTPFRCEDIDLAARASREGFAGAFIPELVVYHHHGRKPGPALVALKKQNDFARGAYFAKMILLKEFKYLFAWLKLWRQAGEKMKRIRECRGAVAYGWFRVFHP